MTGHWDAVRKVDEVGGVLGNPPPPPIFFFFFNKPKKNGKLFLESKPRGGGFDIPIRGIFKDYECLFCFLVKRGKK